VLDVNLTGTFLMTQLVGHVMRAQCSGIIIHLITGSSNTEDNKAAFVTSMNGLERLARQAEHELSPYGIQVYSVENISEKIVARVFALFDLQTEEQ
jgi:NAD(P)-dependent dehydrogenase (short-subunit alcohol dehydrogenase family)